jgi:hypothetical protein
MNASSALYTKRARDLSRLIVERLFGAEQFYYENVPNVRYHIPFDETIHMDRNEVGDFKWSGKSFHMDPTMTAGIIAHPTALTCGLQLVGWPGETV